MKSYEESVYEGQPTSNVQAYRKQRVLDEVGPNHRQDVGMYKQTSLLTTPRLSLDTLETGGVHKASVVINICAFS